MTPTEPREGRPLLGELHSFDEFSKGVAAGTISRRKVLALAGSAALSAALAPFAAPAEAGRRRRNRCRNKPDFCQMNTPETLCHRSGECACVRTTGGNKVCINAFETQCPTTDECDNSGDCPGNRPCVRFGGCCGFPRRNVCAVRCPRGKRARGKSGASATNSKRL